MYFILNYNQNINGDLMKNNNRLYIIISLILLIFSFIIFKLYTIQIKDKFYYKKRLEKSLITKIYSEDVPRGRIYDRNYNLLVDNVGVRSIVFKRISNTTTKDILKNIDILKNNIDIDSSSVKEYDLREYYYLLNSKEIDGRINNKEKMSYKKREITSNEYYNLKLKKITNEELSKVDKDKAYLYYLFNKGYYYEEKTIKNNISEKEYAFIIENKDKLKGIDVKLKWERKYLYGNTFRIMLGNITSSSSGLLKEEKDYYLKKGYSLNDRVGVSYLEKQYEYLLKGKKTIYKLNKDNSYSIIKEGVRGNDIVLTIDINLQKEVENILKEEVINAKENDLNTNYYDGSSVIITKPDTGEILAFSSIYLLYDKDNYRLYDNSQSLVNNPVTPGSIVKGASMSVGYKTNTISIGTKMLDECIKLKGAPLKCSWSSNLGVLDDSSAIMYSSNSYQYKIALSIYDKNKENSFNIYRDMFNQYGLGVKSQIDLPNESLGNKGIKTDKGLLLDYSIGQYDTYTPVQIASYISTIASSGNRYKLHFLKEIRNPSTNNEIGAIKKTIKPVLINKVNLDDNYIQRIRYSFTRVMTSLGYGYMGDNINPAGKTGTAQSFKDIDGDGNIDVETLSKAFVGYAPSDNPKFALVVLSPNVRYSKNSKYTSPVNFKISKRVSNKVFEILK